MHKIASNQMGKDKYYWIIPIVKKCEKIEFCFLGVYNFVNYLKNFIPLKGQPTMVSGAYLKENLVQITKDVLKVE